MAKKADNDSPSPKNERKGTTLWLCIVFFVSAWMFVLGVLVGRGTAPVYFDIESLQKELAGLKEAVQKKEQQWYKIRSQGAQGNSDLGFHEALKKNKVELQLNLKESPSAGPAEKVKKTPAPEPKKVPARTPPSVESDAGLKTEPGGDPAAGSFTIQVAALKRADLADLRVAELSRKGYPAYRTAATVAGRGTWYRVRIGSFKDRSEASRMLERLKGENIGGIIVNK